MPRRTGIVLALIAISFGTVAAEDSDSHEHDRRHHIALFTGATHEHGEDVATIGLDYTYDVGKVLRVGGIYDYAAGDRKTNLLLAAIYLRPVGGLYFPIGIGAEWGHGETHTVARIGVGYFFEIKQFSIGLEYNLDLIEREDVSVYGLTFGYIF